MRKNVYLSFILLFLLSNNILAWHSIGWGVILGLAYLSWNGRLLGKIFLPQQESTEQMFIGASLLLILITLFGALTYYIFSLSQLTIIFILILIQLGLLIAKSYLPEPPTTIDLQSWLQKLLLWLNHYFKFKKSLQDLKREPLAWLKNFGQEFGLLAAYLILQIIAWITLSGHQTTEAINSLWTALPAKFLIIYFLATLVLIGFLSHSQKSKTNLLLISLHYLLSFSAALVVYKIGYGFDPFIHRTAEQYILDHGVITPKTPYYIGQYSLVVFFSTLTQLPVTLIDKILLPLLAATTLPVAIYYFARQQITNSLTIINQLSLEPNLFLLPLVFLLLPWSNFIATTPQGLANLGFLLTIFLSWELINKRDRRQSVLVALLALATLTIHPLAGLPLIFLVAIIILNQELPKPLWAKIGRTIIFGLGTVVTLPIALAWGNSNNIFSLKNIHWLNLLTSLQPTSLIWTNKFNLKIDYLHFFAGNFWWLFAILVIIGFYQQIIKEKNLKYWYFVSGFILLFTSHLIIKLFVIFNSVISYEQTDYASRVLLLATFCLWPLALAGAWWLIKIILKQKTPEKIFVGLLLALGLTSAFYLSHPYNDAYNIGHYYSVSQNDLAAVRWINSSTGGDYIVLANQSTSAAALQEFGFKKYFAIGANPIFYYPVPTASPLYQYYLDLTYQDPSQEKIEQAMNLVGVDQAYVVVNDYWTNFKKVIPQLTSEATFWQTFDNGKIYVFYFKR